MLHGVQRYRNMQERVSVDLAKERKGNIDAMAVQRCGVEASGSAHNTAGVIGELEPSEIGSHGSIRRSFELAHTHVA